MNTDQSRRLDAGGRIDRDRPLAFTFDGKTYGGYAGDTLASALMANGVRLVARSFKYHRPRGITSAGAEEPNALVRLRTGARAEPNLRATQIDLYDGLVAEAGLIVSDIVELPFDPDDRALPGGAPRERCIIVAARP